MNSIPEAGIYSPERTKAVSENLLYDFDFSEHPQLIGGTVSVAVQPPGPVAMLSSVSGLVVTIRIAGGTAGGRHVVMVRLAKGSDLVEGRMTLFIA